MSENEEKMVTCDECGSTRMESGTIECDECGCMVSLCIDCGAVLEGCDCEKYLEGMIPKSEDEEDEDSEEEEEQGEG